MQTAIRLCVSWLLAGSANGRQCQVIRWRRGEASYFLLLLPWARSLALSGLVSVSHDSNFFRETLTPGTGLLPSSWCVRDFHLLFLFLPPVLPQHLLAESSHAHLMGKTAFGPYSGFPGIFLFLLVQQIHGCLHLPEDSCLPTLRSPVIRLFH